MIESIIKLLDEKKASDIVVIDIKEVSPTSDYVVIATANVDRHARFLGNALKEELREQGLNLVRAEGLQGGDWVVLDFFDAIVHIFVPEMREKYQIEKLFADGKVLDLGLEAAGG